MADLEAELTGKGGSVNKIHLRIQQRSGKKRITIIEGFTEDMEVKQLVKKMKKKFSCNGSIEKSKEFGIVVKLSGDQRENVRDFLVKQEVLFRNDDVIVHGY